MHASGLRIFLVLGLFLSAEATDAHANFIINPDFTPTPSLAKRGYFHRGVHGTREPLPGWTVTGGIDVGSQKHWEVLGGVGHSVDLVGSPGRGAISQTITGLTVGQKYEFTFDFAANPARGRHEHPTTKRLQVTLAGSDQDEPAIFSLISPRTASKKNMDYELETIDFTATSDTLTLTLEALAPLSKRGKPYRGAYAGPVISHLNLDVVNSGEPRPPVPEPAGAAMLACGMAPLLLRRRR